MVVGKTARTKNWVSGQKIESFSDLEAGSSDEDDSGSEDGSLTGKRVRKVNGGRKGYAADDDEDGEGTGGPNPANDWDTFEEQARRDIGTSKTSIRTQFLNETLLPHLKRSSLTPQQVSIMLKLLISTYPRYIDARSRDAVLGCLSIILVNDLSPESQTKGKIAETLVKWLENEVTTKVCSSKSMAAGSTIYSLLCWASCIFTILAKSPSSAGGLSVAEQPTIWTSLMRSLTTLYETLLASTSAKRSVKKTGTAEFRRLLRANSKLLPKIMQYLATTNDIKPPYTCAPLLGLAVDVSLRLRARKGQSAGIGKEWVLAAKDVILKFYRDNIIATRETLPMHVLNAFNDFIGVAVTPDDLAPTSELVKSIDRALLRNPEYALPALDCFYQSYINPVNLAKASGEQRLPPLELFQTKLLPAIISASKSSNSLTRSSAALLLSTLSGPSLASDTGSKLASVVVKDICAPLKTHKTASPDHRIALCQLLQSVLLASQNLPVEASLEAVDSLCASLSKEGNESALKATTEVLCIAVLGLLAQGSTDLKTPATLLAKGMQDIKPNFRRIYTGAAGEILWQHAQTSGHPSSDVQEFVKNILPGFQAALKNASTSPVTSAADGWIAVAILKGPLTTWKLSSDIDYTADAQGILSHGAKPSFLLSEKSHRKFVDQEDETWLIRALDAVMQHEEDLQKIIASPSLQSAITSPLLHIASESPHHPARRTALQAIATNGVAFAQCPGATTLFVDALVHTLVQAEKHDIFQASMSDEYYPPDRSSRLQAIVQSIAQGGKISDDVLVRLLVPCHHELVGNVTSWVDAIITASKNPANIASTHADNLLSQIWQFTQHDSLLLRNAAYASLSTLAFVAPASILPTLQERIVSGLDPKLLEFIGSTELGIYNTPAGTAFVDVLSGGDKSAAVTKGKNAAMDKWDQETRAALAAKKKQGTTTLSKTDRALVDAQLAKEAEIRARVADILARIHQSLRIIRSLLSLSTEERDQFLPSILFSLLAAVTSDRATLFAEEGFQTVLKMYETGSSRISDVRLSLALAVLRSQSSPVVPVDFALEDLADLVARVLYRVRFQSEKEPFGPSTFALVYPLLAQCIIQEGAGISKDDSDAILEQLTLTVDIFSFHAKHFGTLTYPRLKSISSLVMALARFPSLGRQISEALLSIGEAIATNSTKSEQAVLLSGLMVDEAQVRHACLQALVPLDLTDMDYSNELWIAVQDTDERNAQLALRIWDDNGLDVKEDVLPQLLGSLGKHNYVSALHSFANISMLGHSSAFVRTSAAIAIAEAVGQTPDSAASAVEQLAAAYKSAAKEKMPVYDQFGMLIEESLHQQDPWQERVAIAETFGHLAALLHASEVVSFFHLLIDEQALGDRSEAVRSKMLEAGIAVIDVVGKDNLPSLMDTFQRALATEGKGSESQDRVFESVIVLLGRLAGFLDGNDPRMLSVIDRLLLALHTPSELVQDAVSECLPPLVRANRDKGSKIIEQLLRETIHAKKYAERRGAAYGLAGAIKGRGISAFKEFDIITRLEDAAEDKKDAEGREGAMFAFETMSAKLGRLFEPYIKKIIPLLLNCLGDSNPSVRQATLDAARVIMSKVSGHGVKLLLPALLDALEDRQWRTKKGAIELMGNMAYLAPRQLSISLPTIIPPLTEVLTDTHAQVRTSANASLKKFGEVVDNPEVKAMQSTLLGALVDPTNKTLKALNTLLTTSFVHYIDPSSLALIIPIIDRGLRERSSEMKRKAAQIVGNLASLTDSKDIIGYLPQLIPRMRDVLVDPVPEARSTAAKSLGVLIERLGEDAFPTLVADLVETLKSDMSGVDQQGAAQGLSEVLAGLGVERMENMLPEIINYTSSPRAYIREGFISLLIYLPSVFGDRFAPYLGRIIQPVLSGLADESEFVREASMRAGRMIVNNHATKAIDLLLPELERGLFDQSWRIRLSSIQLVGELLFKLSGISGKAEFEDENAGDEEDAAQPTNSEAAKKMLDILGRDKRDRVLASLFILRQDSAGQVRLFSINVWKTLVANTPRTTREILPALMQIIIRLLASPSEELREMVARTLGEMCRKQGDRILGDIIPILQEASKGSVSARQGCCFAIAEMLEATNKAQLEGHEDAIIDSVRSALVDEEPSVRQAAALAFDALQNQLGPRSIDQTIPTLLNALTAQGAASDAALSALQELMSVRAHAIFPILIPTLIKLPISAFNAQALASLVTVAGNALNRRLSQILDALQKSAETEKDEETKETLNAATRAVLASVHDTEGLHMLMLHLLGLAKDPRGSKRAGGCNLFASFCEVTEEDFSSYHIDWLRQILSLLDDSDETVVEAAGRAMDAFTKTLTKEQMEGLSVALRRTIEGLSSPGSEIAGFGRPGGLKPVLPILIQGLLAGTNEQREQSAFGLGDIVERTAVDSLKPYVTQITGPLIRIIAERYPAPVKAAILSTLAVLLSRVPQFVRPFFPQLQRTFVKNLSDMTSSTVRSRAAIGLGVLMGLQPRIDPLITELVNGAAHDEAEVRDAMVNALGAVVTSGGANMGPPSREAVANIVSQTLEEPGKEAFNAGVARILAGIVLHSMPQAEPMLSTVLETKASQFSSLCLLTCLENAPQQLYNIVPPSKVVGRILKNVISDAPGVARPAREARDLLKKIAPWSKDEDIQARLA